MRSPTVLDAVIAGLERRRVPSFLIAYLKQHRQKETPMTEIEAQRIVNAVLLELGGRKGLDNELDLIRDDREVYTEMYGALVGRVKAAFDIDKSDPSTSYVYGGE